MYPANESLIIPPDDNEAVTNKDRDNVKIKIKPSNDLVRKYLVS